MSKISTKWIQDQAITNAKLNGDVIGDGLQGASGLPVSIKPDSTTGATVAPLSVGVNGSGVQVDNATLIHTSGQVSVGVINTANMANDSVTKDKISGDLAGNGLVQAIAGELDVNVDNSTLSVVTDVLGVKAGGINTTELAANAVDNTILNQASSYDFNTNGGTILVSDPTNPQEAASKAYVDAQSQGLIIKQTCIALGIANTVLTGLTTIDGIALALNDRVLLNGQTIASENGIWEVKSGSWTRPLDFDIGANAAGAFTFITQGTQYADSGWVCISDAPTDVVDTDSLAWEQFSGAGQINAGAGLTKTGNMLDVGQNTSGAINVNPNDVAVNVDNITLEITGTNPGNINIKAAGVGPTELNQAGAYDFATAGGAVDVTTQLTGDNTNKSASTAFVQQEVAALSTDTFVQEMHKITSGEATAGYFLLTQNPARPSTVMAYPKKGKLQINKQVVGSTGANPDFDILNVNEFHFNNNGIATGLTADFEANDIVIITYVV